MWRVVRNWLQVGDKKEQLAAFVLLAGALIGLCAAFVLSVESLVLASAADTVLSCDINAAVSCSAVAHHWSAKLLGFPNSFIGLATLPVMVTIGVALLAKAKFPRWFLRGAQLGASMGLVFAAWMLYMSVFDIQILCPWCITTDIGMVLLFYGLTRYNILTGVFGGERAKRFVRGGYDTLLAVLALVAMVVVVLVKYNSQIF